MTTQPQVTRAFDAAGFLKKYAIIGILLLFVVALAAMTGGKFLQAQNLINVIRQVSAIGIIAVGMTFVIIARGIDLSVGSILAVSAVVASSLAQLPDAANKMYPGLALPAIVAVLAGLLAGAGLVMGEAQGIGWSPAKGMHLSGDMALNYIVTAKRA